MREDLGDHGRVFDGGDDLQGAAAVGAVLNIDLEHPFNQAQLMRAGTEGGGASPWSVEGVLALTGALGMIAGRSLALGASTPWNGMDAFHL